MYQKITFTWIVWCFCILPAFSQKPILKVATVHHTPPYVMQSANHHDFGFDVDLMKYICNRIEHDCQFIKMDFKNIIPTIQTGEADIGIGAYTISPSRLKQVYFSMPYLPSQACFLTKQATIESNSQNPLNKNMRIGIVEESIWKAYLLEKGFPKTQIFEYSTEQELIYSMHHSQVDFILHDEPAVNFWTTKHVSFRKHGDSIAYGYGMGIAISPQRPEMVNKINMALNDFLNGHEFFQYYHIYFGSQNLV